MIPNPGIVTSENIPTPVEQDPGQRESFASRRERRHQERVKADALAVHDKLLMTFFNFFITHEEPEGLEVAEKLDQLNAQWVTYCKARDLKPFTYDMIMGAAGEIVEKYRSEKKAQPAPPPPPPPLTRWEKIKKWMAALIGKK